MTAQSIVEAIKGTLSKSVEEVIEFRGETSITVSLESLKKALTIAKDQGLDFLLDVSSVDHFGEDPRFEMVYELADLKDSVHLRIKARVGEDEEVPSAVSLWATADWHEREVYDMMGIKFTDHPDMRRILMWEGYPFYPLRKEFPLAGKPTDMPDVAFTGVAPLEGGPFVTSPGNCGSKSAEPRAKGES